MDRTFMALADPVRRAMLARLRAGEATVGELAAPHAITLPGILKHVRYLERAGLVQARKVGRTRLCRLRPGPLASAAAWLDHYRQFWDAQLASLDRFLTPAAPKEGPWAPPRKASSSRSDGPTPSRPPPSSRHGRTRKR
jgi:DNA-binding transcriptional ArsR family regulator